MALPSTLLHFDLHVSHADAGIDRDVALKVARHPSETSERVWLRVLAYAWKWSEGLELGPGLCEPDAPDLVARLPDGRTSAVVRVGKPDPERVEKDVRGGGGASVSVLFESPRRMAAFLAEARERGLARIASAELAAVDPGLLHALSTHAERRIRLSLTFVADHLYAAVAGRRHDAPLERGRLDEG